MENRPYGSITFEKKNESMLDISEQEVENYTVSTSTLKRHARRCKIYLQLLPFSVFSVRNRTYWTCD